MAGRTKGEPTTVIVLELEGIVIKSDSSQYIVEKGNSNNYYPTLSSALNKMSDLILKEKYKNRSEDDIKNINTLIELIEEHKSWFESVTHGF